MADTYDPRMDASLRVLRGGQNGYVRKNTTRLPLDPLRSNAVNIAGFRCAASAVDDGISPLAFGDYERPTTPPAIEPEPLPEGVLVLDTFQDPTSGWIEVSNEQGRFGYHPNEYFHLETKVGGEEVLAFGPTVLDPTRAVSISTAAQVEPNLTGPEGDFKFGIAFAFDTSSDDRPGLVLLADPRNQLWLLCQRQPGGGYDVLTEGPFNWPDRIELRVESDGEGTFELLRGRHVGAHPFDPRRHRVIERFRPAEQPRLDRGAHPLRHLRDRRTRLRHAAPAGARPLATPPG